MSGKSIPIIAMLSAVGLACGPATKPPAHTPAATQPTKKPQAKKGSRVDNPFMRPRLKRIAGEAFSGLDRILVGAKSFFQADHYDVRAVLLKKRFPPVFTAQQRYIGPGKKTTGWVPDKPCCKQPNGTCNSSLKDWSSPTWRGLQFALAGPHRFQWRFTSEGENRQASFVAEARLDLDCKGDFLTYRLTGSVDAEFGVVTKGPAAYHRGKKVAALSTAPKDTTPTSQASPPPAPPKPKPKPVPVRATVLSDKRCKSCKTAALERNLRQRFFPLVRFTHLDYGTAAGKAFYKQLGVRYLPAIAFHLGVKRSPNYHRLARWMSPAGGHLLVTIRARFDPTAEICDNKIDDTGNGKVDCADRTCRPKLICRKERKRQLVLFMMAHCPFAARTLGALESLLPKLKRISLRVHYVLSRDKNLPGNFKALHGKPEIVESKRRVCAERYARRRRKRYHRYLYCRAAEFRKGQRNVDWKKCARAARLPVRRIERCAAGALGIRLLTRNIKLTERLKISASPNLLVNNRYKFHAIREDALKREICKHNKKLRGCR